MNQISYVAEIDDTITQATNKQHSGKMKTLITTKLCTITIGPDYCLFIPAFSFFIVIGVLVTNMVFNNSDNTVFRLATIFVCLGQPLSYLLVALSNPGIISQSIIQIPAEQVSTINDFQLAESHPAPKTKAHKYCKKCNIYVKPTTFHCSDCQLCIEQYDHHCPWVSKCIGKRNLVKFYIFLTMTPVFMVYCFISFFACIDLNEKPNA